MGTLIHKPQREAIKPFCLERAREGYGESIFLRSRVSSGSTEITTSDALPGPVEVVRATFYRDNKVAADLSMHKLYASDHPNVNVDSPGMVRLAAYAKYELVLFAGQQTGVVDFVGEALVGRKLYFAPVYFTLWSRNIGPVEEFFWAIIQVKGFNPD